jgi:HEPN domain-containing protein
MNEREVAEVLKEHFENRGYKVLLELQINENDCTMTFPGYVKQRRPDLLLIDPFSNIVAIEVENEPFVEHPEVFREISNITYLAFPASSLKKEHIVRFFTAELRRSINSGIGLLSVSKKAVKTLVGPATRKIPESMKDELIRLSEKRIQKEIRVELIEYYKFMYEKSRKHWDKACSLLEEGLHSEFYKEGKHALVFALKARYTQMLRELPSIYTSITELYDSLIRYSQTLKSRPRWLPIKKHMDKFSEGKSKEPIEIYNLSESIEDSLKRLGVSLDIGPVVVVL